MDIVVDCDGVLYEWGRTACYMLREYKGYTNLARVAPDWDYYERMVEKEDWKWLWNEGVPLGLYRHGHSVKGSLDGIRALKNMGHNLYFVTHRPENGIKDTISWLDHRFGGEVIYPWSGVHILTSQESKTSVPADVYIDDKRENISDVMLNTGAKAVVFDQPWNWGSLPGDGDAGRFARCKGWPEVIAAIRRWYS